ncbi:hypothetical protein [Sanyastnella coralliicola]|uniref:hypothetical protein n=1 Tax=Sanyastnella coralliicola TaxID=3069118 RepID=UPI0027BB1FAC|nr:hypothetical protein [Longitalea sp. SCSIO 12813]
MKRMKLLLSTFIASMVFGYGSSNVVSGYGNVQEEFQARIYILPLILARRIPTIDNYHEYVSESYTVNEPRFKEFLGRFVQEVESNGETVSIEREQSLISPILVIELSGFERAQKIIFSRYNRYVNFDGKSFKISRYDCYALEYYSLKPKLWSCGE